MIFYLASRSNAYRMIRTKLQGSPDLDIISEGLRDILWVVLHDIKDSCTEAGLSVTI
jgi:hypothetical protein